MSSPTASFAALSLKVVAVRTTDSSDFEFEFPTGGPQTTLCALTAPLELPWQRRRDPFDEIDARRHEGLNE